MPPSPCMVISPAVRLSPKAANVVAVEMSRGGATRVTENEHVPLTAFESTPVHVTVVEPTGNVDSLGGTHVICTGGVPPVDVGVPYRTATGSPVDDGCE